MGQSLRENARIDVRRPRRAASLARLTIITAAALLLAFPLSAYADSMTATRPGLMCKSADALSKLTLPDGRARPDEALKQSGGCIGIPDGATVEIQKWRHNTSIVTYDGGQGPQTYYVPNIDFSSPGAGQAGCLSYDRPVTLSGIVTNGKVYGEDNFGKVGWMEWVQISLLKPICILGNQAKADDPEQGIKAVQFYSDNHAADHLHVGQAVSAIGTLDEAIGPHWNLPVIFDIQSVR